MNSKDKRLFNFRPPVLVCLCVMAGVFVANFIVTDNHFKAISILLIVIVGLISLDCQSFFRKLIKSHKVCVFACVIGFLFSLSGIWIGVFKVECRNLDNFEIIATATITDVSQTYLYVENVCADYYSEDEEVYKTGVKLDGTLRLQISSDDYVSYNIGENIVFKATVSFNQAIEDGKINSYYFVYDSLGIGYTTSDDILKTNTTTNVDTFAFLRKACKDIFDKNMSKDAAGLAYAMIFGDKSDISMIYEDFRSSGLAHLLAVSGLHVGFFTLLLMFVAKLLRLKNLPKFIFVTTILFLYTWICGFSPSILRAFIMSTVAMLATIRGKQYDGLNSLAISAIIILFINPFYLLDLGFQLSYISVLFIFMLSPALTRNLSKFLGKKLASSLAMSIAATVGTLPIVIQIYPNQSAISIFTNLIAIPISSIGFMACIITTIITAIFPFMGFIMVIPEFAFNILIFIAKSVANMTDAFVTFIPVEVFISLVVILSVLISDYIFVKKPIKQTSAGILCIAFFVMMGIY